MYDVWGVVVVVGTLALIVLGLVFSHEDLPACGEVWTAGSTLPRDYQGCQYPSGATAGAGFTCADCSILFDYRLQLYAVADGIIESGYREAYLHCLTGR